MQSLYFKAALLSDVSKDLIGLEFNALQNVVSDYNDDQPAGFHDLRSDFAEPSAIIEICCSVVRPSWTPIRALLGVDRA